MKRNLVELMQTRFPTGSRFDYVAKKIIFVDNKDCSWHQCLLLYMVFMTLPCTESSELLVPDLTGERTGAAIINPPYGCTQLV